jgi:hypothetical protein
VIAWFPVLALRAAKIANVFATNVRHSARRRR